MNDYVDLANPEVECGSAQSKPSSLYLVLEGGGAKGIAHIAAWDELEPIISPAANNQGDIDDRVRKRFTLEGTAGTSAGAIVAALIAAGARSDQLIDAEGRMPLCSALGIRYFYDLFGVRGWRRLKLIRNTFKAPRALRASISRLAGQKRKLLVDRRREKSRHSHSTISKTKPTQYSLILMLFRMIILIFILIALCFLIGLVFDFFIVNRPMIGSYFVMIWTITAAIILAGNQILRRAEQSGRKIGKRHISRPIVIATHPITAFTFAIHYWDSGSRTRATAEV